MKYNVKGDVTIEGGKVSFSFKKPLFHQLKKIICGHMMKTLERNRFLLFFPSDFVYCFITEIIVFSSLRLSWTTSVTPAKHPMHFSTWEQAGEKN